MKSRRDLRVPSKPVSQGVALGWHGGGALPLGIAAAATLKAKLTEVLASIAPLL